VPRAGNSGGPALRGDVVVGVAFQNLPHADNIGYIIPLPVVRRFLRCARARVRVCAGGAGGGGGGALRVPRR
jgi:hypothetical protein